MNYIQFGLFIIFAFSALILGIYIYGILENYTKGYLNKTVYIGEALLLGSIFLVGQMLLLSLVGLYRTPFLWAVVSMVYFLLFSKVVRRKISDLFFQRLTFNLSTVIFVILFGLFIIRNCYFLIDVDSLSTYLFTQKLWLNSGTSLIGSATDDIRIFSPQFDAVPYSLGISIFGQETLFPQLINVFWRGIVLLLVFGYTKYRFNGYYALAALMFVLFNDHFFYSGANQYVIINPVIIALMFASAYNFWEARVRNNSLYFVLALIFSVQIMANKLYVAFSFLFLVVLGFLIQPNLLNNLKEIYKNKKWFLLIIITAIIASIFYIKNYIVTGNPLFPVLNGVFKTFGWSKELGNIVIKQSGGLKPLKIFKYLSFLFVWPGINPAKYVLMAISLLPLVFLIYTLRHRIDRNEVSEICFWLAVCVLSLIGLCLGCWQDPRIYRFYIGMESFTAVLSLRFILKYCLNIKKEIVLAGMIVVLAVPGYRIIFQGGNDDPFKRPTFEENIGVITNQIHMDYIIKKHHPYIPKIVEKLKLDEEKIRQSAWDVSEWHEGVSTTAFLLPLHVPIVSLWYSTTIGWDSYSDEKLILKDLHRLGIKWIMRIEDNGKLLFIPIDEYASEAVKYDRYPKKISADYGFPAELTGVD